MSNLNNIDMGNGRVKYLYCIEIESEEKKNPVQRMQAVLSANIYLFKWTKKHANQLGKYKLSGNNLYLKTKKEIELFKNTYPGKENKQFTVRSI